MKSAVWFWGTGGAGSRVMARLADCLSEMHGTQNTALLMHSDNQFLDAMKSRGHKIFTVRGAAGHRSKIGLVIAAPWRALLLISALIRHRPSIVIIPINFALACPLALIVRGFSMRLIYLVHDAEPHSGDFAPRWQRITQRWLIAQAHRVVVMSEYVRERVLVLNPDLDSERVDVVPLHMLGRKLRRGERPTPTGPLRFLFFGRLLHYKGLDLLAQALKEVAQRSDWLLTIAGDGPERENVIKWFGEMPQVDITRVRYIKEAEIERLIDSHDILICPYRDASQSASVAEALYAGMPSLVTPAGGLAEQIGHGKAGWVSTAATPEAIALAVQICLDRRDEYAARSASAAAFARTQLACNPWPIIFAKAASLPK